MRVENITIVAALVAGAAASPYSLRHRHAHGLVKRQSRADSVVYVPAATVTSIVYWLDDHAISEDEVRQGIANGTLIWGDDGVLSTSTNVPIALATSAPASASEAPVAQESFQHQPVEPVSSAQLEPPAQPEPSAQPEPPTSQAAPVTEAAQPSSNPAPSDSFDSSPPPQSDSSSRNWADLVDQDGYCASCDKEFPNNKIPCTEFPYGYGALPIVHEGLGGWSGIQDPQYSGGDGFDDITTVVKGSCSDGSCCTAGSFCSYGCPNPYLKLSFPSKQGRTGQSVGGLYCNNNGYLEMADGSLGKTLCGQSSKSMTVKVQNNLSKSVSFCRTDYPGESYDELADSCKLSRTRHRVNDVPAHTWTKPKWFPSQS
ncbi:hypothetical protein NX059_001234 [Plenodomus lindquistii]|nr:hypothetical protein NX059_001234 [Plenodomus lindquistii]